MARCRQCGQNESMWKADVFTGVCARCRAGVSPVNLGCGTLIIIAVIVYVFGRAGSDDVQAELNSLRSSVRKLQQSVDMQTHGIERLHRKTDKLVEVQGDDGG